MGLRLGGRGLLCSVSCGVVGEVWGDANGLTAGLFYWSNLTQNATPAKEKYLSERYAGQWDEYKKEVRWKMFPGLW